MLAPKIKYSLSLLLLLFSLEKARADDQLPNLISTANYDPKSEKLLGPIEWGITGAGLYVAGGIVKRYFLHIDQIVESQLSNPAIHSYFADPKIRASISKEISDHVNNVIFKSGIDNASSLRAVKFISNQILKHIIWTIMDSQGVPRKRQIIWEDAIKKPIDDCIAKSSSFFQANHCVDAYSPDAIKNIELSVVYEAAKNTLAGVVPNATQGVLSKTIPAYRACLAALPANSSNGFTQCVNRLIVNAGDLAIPAVVNSDSTVKSAIPSSTDRDALSKNIVKQFNQCLANNQARGLKDSNGLVETTNCETDAGNAGIYFVSLALYKQNIITNLGAANLEPAYSTGKNALDRCWGNGSQANAALNECLRSTVILFTSTIANQLVAREIPPALNTSNPNLRKGIISSLGTCLKSELPQNILPNATGGSSGATDEMTQAITSCTGRTEKDAAIKLAHYTLEQTLAGNVPADSSAQIIHRLVDVDLAECLGEHTSAEKVNTCVISLKKNGAKTIAAKVFPEQFDKFTSANGGQAALGLSDKNKSDILSNVQTALSACLDRNVTARSANDDGLNSCFKDSIRNFSLQLGIVDFNKTAAPYFSGKENDLNSFRKTFQASFGDCLDQKKGKAFSIGDYVSNVSNCSTTLVSSLTEKIANYALNAQVESHLPGTDPDSVKIRKDMEAALAASLHSCLASVKNNDDTARNTCTDNLQRQGTYAVAAQSGRSEIMSLLKATKPIKEEIDLNAKLKSCLDVSSGGPALSDALNNCAKDYATNLARSIGSIELSSTLNSALGSTVTNQRKTEIIGYLSAYNKCLDDVHATAMDDGFMDRVNSCASILESNAVAMIDSYSREWMKGKTETPDAAQLKDQVSKLIPCLSMLVPTTTYQEDSLAQVNPTGMLQGLSQTIGQFIDYDVQKAGGDIQSVMSSLFTDFSKVGSDQAKQNLINNMVQTGMVDQLLKAVVKSNVEDAFSTVPSSEVPSKLQVALLDKKNFDAIFDANTIQSLRQSIAKTILIPAIVQGKSMDSPEITASTNVLKKQIAGILLQSPHFGDALLVGAVQNQINSQNVAVKFFASLLYGKSALDWSKVRNTPDGKTADDYIRSNIMAPVFNGQTISSAQSQAMQKQASNLVKKAMEDYKNATKDTQS